MDMDQVEKIDHIGIAVHSLAAAIPIYRDLLGLPFEGEDVVAREGVRVAFFRVGETRIELLQPTGEGGAIAGFLKKRGEGIHHIALRVRDIEKARTHVERGGARLLSEQPLSGAHGTLISFLHPGDTGRVLIELLEAS